MEWSYDSVSESTLSTIMQELVSQQAPFDIKEPRYLVSMSTCPLATTMSNNISADQISHDWLFHSDLCATGKCMFYNKNHKCKDPQFINKRNPSNRKLEPICWLTMTKHMSYHKGDKGTIDPATVEFDLDSRGVLEDTYSPEHRGTTIKGYDDILGPSEASFILGKTYWYKRHAKTFKLEGKIQALYKRIRRIPGENEPSVTFNKTLRSILLTMNGILIKKIVFLARECGNYSAIAEQTAQLFVALCNEHSADIRYSLKNTSSAQATVYEEAKKFFNYVKQHFNHEDRALRLSILNFTFKNKALKSLFKDDLANLRRFITYFETNGSGDYSKTLMWKFRMSHVCQTRTLDHLARFIALEQVDKYVQLMTRAVYIPVEREMNIIHTAVWKNLDDFDISRKLFISDEFQLTPEKIKSSLQFELKGTASYHTTVQNGGKLEDARLLLAKIKKNEWKIPIRNLETGEIEGYTPLVTDDTWDEKGIINLSSIIFWTSLQTSVNFLCIHGLLPEKGNYYPMMDDGEEWMDNFLNYAKLIGIDEPGAKLRLLLKTNSILNWSLSLASGMLQDALATHPEHRAGLELGSQDWNFNKRISGESPESRFLYTLTGKIREKAHFGATDYSQATDGLAKFYGYQMMKTFMSYTRFYGWYGNIFLELTRLPFSVVEQKYIDFSNGETVLNATEILFSEGYMMGVQGTKVYLHLTHVMCEGLTSMWMEKKGFRFDLSGGREQKFKLELPEEAEFRTAIKIVGIFN